MFFWAPKSLRISPSFMSIRFWQALKNFLHVDETPWWGPLQGSTHSFCYLVKALSSLWSMHQTKPFPPTHCPRKAAWQSWNRRLLCFTVPSISKSLQEKKTVKGSDHRSSDRNREMARLALQPSLAIGWWPAVSGILYHLASKELLEPSSAVGIYNIIVCLFY